MEICVDNLTVNENTKNKLLENISFVAKSTQTLGIIGPSGSGKTTLLHALAGITNANLQVSGVITYTDQERVQQQLTEKSAIKKHLSLGYVPQDAMNVFDPIEKMQKQFLETFCENGWSIKEGEKKTQHILENFQLNEKVLTQYPHELSGGILQRCAVGIALEMEPQILLADEPTSSLDSHTKQFILKKLDEYTRQNNTILLLTSHEYSVIQMMCDDLLILKRGQCAYFGSIKQAETDPKAVFYSEIKEIDEVLTNHVKELWRI
ncbi:TPA: ATP-binding cassette domain-containing protein [Enterococcus faecium]|uniref:ABC transporter domain-containing protein n=1 Tax=Candidatus Enterococcus wittei TaxID=1987383 RepID=A0A242K1K4_9ENTE|nr:ATP-binding cassette domain-containing protein [Enterococcus sp. 10A9_DIV0425]OTP11154.1 hypothetical protein A5844_001288 [Enterococcus sp. 10A9_DIV0425]THE13543.1 ATP-binding cassette domain-containing protein [Enterococcus hirae]